MTSTIDAQDPDVPVVPKKRRRRAAATGASEDCFTCRKRQTKCDRRRPYCGQCLEVGKDCSGYRTTLTWGVGVASRGKLRGLSCPVARQPGEEAAVPEQKKTGVVQKRKPSTSKASKIAKDAIFKSAYTEEFSSAPTVASTSTNIKPIKSEFDYESTQGMSMPIPIQTQWHYSEPYHHHPSLPRSIPRSYGPSLESDSGLAHLHTSLNHSVDSSAFPLSASSMSTYSDADFASPEDFPPSPMQMHFADPFAPFLGTSYPNSDAQELDTGSESVIPFFESPVHIRNLSFAQPQYGHQDVENESQYLEELDSVHDMDITITDMDSHQQQQQQDKRPINFGFTLPRSLFYSHFFHLPTRMQYLLDYYNKHICSVLVAFDSPINPYRHHVLELATQNEGLQNAIAALAINNLRMRNQERVCTAGFVQDLMKRDPRFSHDDSKPSPEESCYKSVSINQLQMQLATPSKAQDDSILATLLILCLFHVCDSGFSKFKTQLEGVQKLLSMRDPSLRTGFIGWVEMFFTWFDVMTSTVNDRETEIRGDRLDMMQYSSDLGALEQYSGCDGRLFKLIARLGRLNLLSQDRPVRVENGTEASSRSFFHSGKFSNSMRPMGPQRWQKRKIMDPMDFTKLDGNGWGSSIISDDEDCSATYPQAPPGDTRHEFWYEWNDIRTRLQAWSMDPSNNNPAENIEDSMGVDQLDMMHINESFRSSALLYTERLAHPHLPSSSPNFQALVHDALTQITSISITSCVNKFLLWPLFIAGTECVDSNHRAIVRDRCLEIMRESGFYNNISVLEVLERVWAEQGNDTNGSDMEEVMRRRKDSAGPQGGFGQAFRWRKAMDRVDGEYIIV